MSPRICPTCHEQVETDDLFCPRDGTRLLKPSVYEQIAAESEPLVGTRIANRYLVIRKVGEGGMGDVYLAEHEDIEKEVAIKILKQEYSSRPEVVARFRQEAVSASRIKHPNVVEIFDFGRLEDGRFYLAMEWLDGQDLATVLGEEGKLRAFRAIPIAEQACRALEAAHRNGVIHRDLKPENIFLIRTEETDSFVKILDFGIAKLTDPNEGMDAAHSGGRRKMTKTGMIFGTPEYMSPEQAKGQSVDHRSDIYAMGVILFEMLTGQVPFYGDTFMAVLTAHLTQAPPKLNEALTGGFVSEQLERVVDKALAKNPDDRYATMTELRDALLATPEAMGQTVAQTMSQRPLPLVQPKRRAPIKIGSESAAAATDTTQLEIVGDSRTATGDRQQTETKRSGLVWWGLAGLVILVIAGLAVALRYVPESHSHQKNSAAHASVSSSATSRPRASASAHTQPNPRASAAPSGTQPTARSTPIIHIITRPPGAVISKREENQLFQVCPSSPCDYPAQPDEKVTFVARLPGLEGVGSALARTSQDLTITLRPTYRTNRTKSKPQATSKKKSTNQVPMCKYCEPKGDPDCIYILRPCKKP